MSAVLIGCALVLSGEAAKADLVFLGEDINRREEGTNNNDTLRIRHPNSDSARTAFLSNLADVSTENFDGFTPNSTPSTLTFGTTTATLSPPLTVLNLSTGTFNGIHPISEDQVLSQNVGSAS